MKKLSTYNFDDLIELVQQRHNRALTYPSVRMHNKWQESVIELKNRFRVLEKQVSDLEEALFGLIPVSFHGDKKAFNDTDFTEAFKKMVLLAYMKNA
ncbi:hypothetical protein LCGC14_1323690 [marine sediment metagenome]|uniref:Uncharacterized protein n=1 Tax=marine sediment metagenome TaxID=412755 RepID=A0A0F9MZJ9_9ZZZZ|nr:hypothetical protein [Pricia sp.]